FWGSVNQAPNGADSEVFVAPLEPKKFGKGMDIHTESNPLPLVKRPALLVRGTTSN
ncbi:major capsid protein, partial [Methylobacterium sp. BTF04]